MPKEQFKQEVERELRGKETEPWEIIYFKLYQSQAPVIERGIETAGVECCRGSSGIRNNLPRESTLRTTVSSHYPTLFYIAQTMVPTDCQ
jgi:hypothetical protein